jgi:hypothetical protein
VVRTCATSGRRNRIVVPAFQRALEQSAVDLGDGVATGEYLPSERDVGGVGGECGAVGVGIASVPGGDELREHLTDPCDI